MLNKFKSSLLLLSLATTLVLPTFIYAQSSDSDNVNVNQQVNNGPVTPPGGGGGSGSGSDVTPPTFMGVQVSPSENQGAISWSTNEPTRAQVIWGTTQDYSDGTLSNTNLLSQHIGLLTGLNPNTRYYFKIIIADSSGNTAEYSSFFVTTNPQVDITVPNTSNFVVNPNVNRLDLTWTNPDENIFDSVRLLRSTKFYPLDPFNGQVVYEGENENYIDRSVVPGVVYYYTLFSVSADGRYSSGTIGRGMIAWYSEPGGQPQEPGVPIVDLEFFPSTQTPTLLLSAEDFKFVIGEDGQNLNPNQVQAYVGETLKITIPADKVFSETTAITGKIIFADGTSSDTSYLFSYNKKTEQYELLIPKFAATGDNKLEIVIFDAERKVLQKLVIPFTVLESDGYLSGLVKTESGAQAPNFYYFFLFIFLVLLVLILIIILLMLLYRAMSKKRNEDRIE